MAGASRDMATIDERDERTQVAHNIFSTCDEVELHFKLVVVLILYLCAAVSRPVFPRLAHICLECLLSCEWQEVKRIYGVPHSF